MARNSDAAGGGNEDLEHEALAQGQEDNREERTEGQGEAEGSAEYDRGQEGEGLGEEIADEPPRHRAADRIRTLSDEVRELRERLSVAERGPVPQAPRQQLEETEEQFNARIRDLAPDERMEQRMLRSERQNNIERGRMQVQMTLQTDKMNYDAKAAGNTAQGKILKKYSSEVERELQKALSGQPVEWSASMTNPREQIAAWLHWKAINAQEGDVDRQRNRGKDNVRREQTRPPNSRGEVPARRERGETNEREARRRRLENATF